MGKKSTPPPPDYTGAVQQQAQANQQNLAQQTWANRADQTSPYGSSTWSSEKVQDPATGQMVDKWTQNTTLDPKLQSSLDAQMNVQDARSQQALGLVGRMNNEFGQPMDWGNLQQWGTAPNAQNIDTSLQQGPQLQQGLNFGGVQNVQSGAPAMQQAQNAAYSQAASRLDPQFAEQQRSMETELANQGITKGSDAYQKAMDQFGRQKTDAYNQATYSSIGAGNQAAQQQQAMDLALRGQQVGEIGQQGTFANQAAAQGFGFGQQARAQQMQAQQGLFGQQQQAAQFQNQQRQQQITEAMQKRGFSLNEINSLLSGQQVNMPQFAGYNQAGMAATPDYMGAMQNTYGANLDASNAANASSAQTMQGVGAAASIAVMI